jgi:hypothetical protein
MSELSVRCGKAALASGSKFHPANASAGSNRSSQGGDEMAEAFGHYHSRLGSSFPLSATALFRRLLVVEQTKPDESGPSDADLLVPGV